MSKYSKTIGEIEIECPYCKCKKSYKNILLNNASEFGECMNCGRMTYNKVLDGLNPKPKTIVECPYCHSTNTTKISTSSKVGKIALFGIFSIGKVTKQWHCNNCKSDF